MAVVSVTSDEVVVQEPIGIVISRGSREEPAPLLWAYVWGPAPADEAPEETRAA